MNDDKASHAATEKASAPGAPAASIRVVEDAPLGSTEIRSDRTWAAAGYFASLAGIWIVIPALALALKGRQSLFVGFHALQAVLLQVATIPFVVIGMGASTALEIWIAVATSDRRGNAPLANLVGSVSLAIVFTVPAATSVWLGWCALRGQPRALPLIGRLAKRMAKDMYRA